MKTNLISNHEHGDLYDYDILILNGKMALKKCFTAANCLADEHFSYEETWNNLSARLLATYSESESFMYMILDYIKELNDIFSDLTEILNSDIKKNSNTGKPQKTAQN